MAYLLAELRILVTRPRHQLESILTELEKNGARVMIQPAIEIGPPDDWGPVDRAIEDIGRFDWIVFSSANGVSYFMDRFERQYDARRLAGVHLAAIGPATADALRLRRLHTDLTPDEYRAESLADAIIERIREDQKEYTSELPPDWSPVALLVRASRGREVLAQRLTESGITVEQVVAYTSRDVIEPDPQVRAALTEGRIDWITVTSSAIARSLINMLGEDLHRARLAAISPITSKTLTDAGYQPTVEAEVYTIEGLIDAIKKQVLIESNDL